MSSLLYAVGDIHGDLKQLQKILGWIRADLDRQNIHQHRVVFVGDLVDRREDSRGVIDLLMTEISNGAPWTVLRGNHDRMFSLFFEDAHIQDPILRTDLTWLNPRLGGLTTLASYGVDIISDQDPDRLRDAALRLVPKAHRDFLLDLPNSFETDHFFFAHAGVNPLHPLTQQSEDDLIWIRTPFHEHTDPFEKKIVHGHTPVDRVTDYGNRLNIDTGAAYGGPLSVIVIEGDQAWELEEHGRGKIFIAT